MLVRDSLNRFSGPAAMAPEDGTGAAAPGADGKPLNGGAPPGDGSAAPGANEPAAGPYRPEGLPDHLFGKSDKETVDQLFKAFTGYRTAESQRAEKFGTIPKDEAGYKVELPDDLKAYVPELDKDPVYNNFRKRAGELGITDKQFAGLVTGFMKDTISLGGVEKPYDPEAEREALIPQTEMPDPAERAREVDRRSRDAMAYVDVLTTRGLDKAAADAVKGILDTAAGIKLVEYFRGQAREVTPALGGNSSGITREDLKARTADPRNDPRDPKYDQAFATETSKLYRQVLGSSPRA